MAKKSKKHSQVTIEAKQVLRFTEALLKKGYTPRGNDQEFTCCINVARYGGRTFFEPSVLLRQFLEIDRRNVFLFWFEGNHDKAWEHYRIAQDLFLQRSITYSVDYLIFRLRLHQDTYVLTPRQVQTFEESSEDGGEMALPD